MFLFEIIAEERIREAIEKGEFANLPGAGKPLRLEDDSMVPEDLRIAYKILKNAGCIPPELELRKEILTLRDLLRTAEDENAKRGAVRELNAKLLKLNVLRKRTVNLDDFPEYRDRILRKWSDRKAE
ncbi:MAG TPA: DnaJ family domain-containing protein [Candidatus Deferrimicrobiaceae bacterium]|nr:DnaJ family domain-containing protein [Candidatus Deferrimicrobiaceae bacterium]